MRPIFLVLSILTVACNPAKKEGSTTITGAANREAPYLWSNYSAPKSLQISNDFTASEISNIHAMSTAWKTGLEDKKTFFDYGAQIPENCNSSVNLDSYLDSTLGVYKCATWPVSLPSSALAVTQIFGRRHNVGTSTEYVDIEHADIMVNYDFHSFDTADEGPGYDLRTVILHEMGHFIGLGHKSTSSNRNASIMYPSISSSEAKRAPLAIDIADLASRYNISLTSGGVVPAMVADMPKIDYVPNPEAPSESVKVIFELHADGECVHKINGILSGHHRVEIKK